MKKQITHLIWMFLIAACLIVTPARAKTTIFKKINDIRSTLRETTPNENSYLNTPKTTCSTWTQVNTDAFGLGQGTDNGYSGGVYRGYISEESFEVTTFNNQLYLGMEADNVYGARLWRTKASVFTPQSQSDWEEVIADANGYPFGLPNPSQADHIDSIEPFGSYLYASIANRTGSPQGIRIFRSPTGDSQTWTNAVETEISGEGNQFSAVTNENFKDMQVFQNHLCGGTGNTNTGTQIWCSSNGTTWEQKNISGFGKKDNFISWSGMVYANALLFGVQDANGTLADTSNDIARLYRTTNLTGTPVWTPVFTGTQGSGRVDLLGELGGYLYISHKSANGVVILRSSTATAGSWIQVNDLGMTPGHAANTIPIVDGAAVFENELYVAIVNQIDGVEIWKTAASSPDGRDWVQVGANGMGDAYNIITELIPYNGSLYAWTSNYLTGQQVLRLDCNAQPVETSKIITVGVSGCISLNDAVNAANQGITINGCTGSASTDIIMLAKSINITTTLPTITSTILLDGSGYTLNKAAGSGDFTLFNTSATGYLQITHLAARGFTSLNGPVLVNTGMAEVNRSVFYNNIATGSGGSIYSTGSLRFNQSTLSGNQAGFGGAIYTTGILNVFASSIVSNTAFIEGGGIYNSNSSPASANLKITILAKNNAPLGSDCHGGLYSQSFNLIRNTEGCDLSGNLSQIISGLDPQITPLNQNGNTSTNLPSHMLLPGSPAVDIAPPEICPNLDFRYKTHNVDYPQVGNKDSCDLGPYELQNPEINRATVNGNTVNFANVMVTITDNAPPLNPHPGSTLVHRYGIPAGGIPASAYELPFQVQITPTISAGLDINLTLCYSPWELSQSNPSPNSGPPQVIARVTLPAKSEPSTPQIDASSLQLFRFNSQSIKWELVGADIRANGCVTKNHVTELGRWTIAAKQPTSVTLKQFIITPQNRLTQFQRSLILWLILSSLTTIRVAFLFRRHRIPHK